MPPMRQGVLEYVVGSCHRSSITHRDGMINFTDLAGFNWSSPKMYMSNSQSTITNRSRSAGCLLRFVDLADSNRQCFPFSSTQKCILYALKSKLSHAMVTCCHFWELGVTVSKVSNVSKVSKDLQPSIQ